MRYLTHGNSLKIDRKLYAVHSGSWFGLPDFGVTEAVGGLFGAPKTAQGGSNLFGSPTKAQTTVLGSNTQKANIPTGIATAQAPSGGARTVSNVPTNNQPTAPSGPNEAQLREQQVRNDINSGYNNYFGQLDSILNEGLPGQRTAQENIANSQLDQGVNSLNTQKTLGQQDLAAQHTKADTQQGKTLQDLSNNIRNLFQSGNVYLGAKGAGDSSAANQYSYALTKMGSQQRGDVTSQYADIHNDINGRETRLNEVYNGQVKDLQSQHDQQINGIAQWFSEQQNALKQAKAQGQLSQGQDLASLSQNLLNVALQQLQNVQSQAQQHKQALDEWAMNHSNDIGQLRNNLSQVSTTNYNMPTASPVNGQPAVAGGAGNPSLFGFGAAQDAKRTNIFGQPIG